MAYITTNHRFVIDEQHPADVFEEMENFFSLYTVAMDKLQQVSIQLAVPASFDIQSQQPLADSYRQFIQSVRYTIPDVNVLPVKTRSDTKPTIDDVSDTDTTTDNTVDQSVILLIQRYEGVTSSLDDQPAQKTGFYQQLLGKFKPKFTEDRHTPRLYPKQAPEQLTLPDPTPPVSNPRPMSRPMPTNTVTQPQQNPQPTPQPVAQQTPSALPIRTATPTSTTTSNQRVEQPLVKPNPSALPLPNIQQSAAPYRALLTEAIIAQARNQASSLTHQPITQITLKSADSLTTAMIEQLFQSFYQAGEGQGRGQVAHDAIDLVSYGYEILKPALAKIGVTLADDAQFGLKARVKSTPEALARLSQGQVRSHEIKLSVQLKTKTAARESATMPATNSVTQTQLNQANHQHIALMIHITDALGHRQQLMSQFPIVFTTRDSNQVPNALRLFSSVTANEPNDGMYFSIIELNGEVRLGDINPAVAITRQGERLASHDVLWPGDNLTIMVGAATMQIQLELPPNS